MKFLLTLSLLALSSAPSFAGGSPSCGTPAQEFADRYLQNVKDPAAIKIITDKNHECDLIACEDPTFTVRHSHQDRNSPDFKKAMEALKDQQTRIRACQIEVRKLACAAGAGWKNCDLDY